MLAAAANSPFLRPSLRGPAAVAALGNGRERGSAKFASSGSPSMSPLFVSLPDSVVKNGVGHTYSPRLGAQTVAYGALVSRVGSLSRVASFSLLSSAKIGNSPLMQTKKLQQQQVQQDHSPSALRRGSFSVLQHQNSTSLGVNQINTVKSSNKATDTHENVFAANDEVSWRNERAKRASPYLAAISNEDRTSESANGFIDQFADSIVASADAVAPAEYTVSELEFKRNDFIDVVDEENNDGDNNNSASVDKQHPQTACINGRRDTDIVHVSYDTSVTSKPGRSKKRSRTFKDDTTSSKSTASGSNSGFDGDKASPMSAQNIFDSRENASFDFSHSDSAAAFEESGALFVDEDGTAVDLRNYESHAGRDFSLIQDDFALDMRHRLNNADAADGAYAAELAAATRTKAQELTVRAEWMALFNCYRTSKGEFDDPRICADAESRIAQATSSYEIANVLQGAADMENAFSVSCEPAETLYDAEVLRDRNIRRERAIERARAHKQLMWYISTYGDDKGKEMYEIAREQRAKAVKPRLTRAEMRKQLYAAEHALNNVSSEFAGYLITAITVVMFLIHPNITQQFFMMLSCKSIGGVADPGASFMLGDLSEPCYSSQHLLFILVLGVPMLIFWVIGIPLFAWVILYRNRALIQTPATGASDITRAQKKVFESQMAFLYRGYKPTRYYWFLVEMFRKAALVAIAVFFPGALHTQLMMASLLIFACILAQIFAKPFENRIPGAVEFLSLGTSFMIFFLANFLFVDTVSHTAKVVATVLICVLVIFFFVVVVAALVVLQREEMQLAPLRRQLREAHILGHDIAQVMRKWRQEQLRERKLCLDKKTVANSKHLRLPSTTATSATGITDNRCTSAQSDTSKIGERRSHDEVLVLGSGVTPSWSRTFDLVRDDAASDGAVLGAHRREVMLAAAAAAANGTTGDGQELGASHASTAAEDAIAGAEARLCEQQATDDPTVIIDLTAPPQYLN